MSFDDVGGASGYSDSIVAAVWRYKAASALIVFLVAAVAAGIGYAQAPQPSAAASFGVIGTRDAYPLSASAPSSDVQLRNVQDQAAFAQSEPVLDAAATGLGSGATPGQLRASVSVSADLNANIVRVVASAPTLALAERRADAVVAAYRKLNGGDVAARVQAAEDALSETQKQLEASRGPATATSAAAQTLANVQNQLLSVRMYARTYGDGVRYVNPAKRVRPSVLALPVTRNGILGLGLGLLVACVIAATRSVRATRRTGSPDWAVAQRPLVDATVG